jgi:RNA polymerase sigma factor for flagellar operon FliA
MKKNGRTAYEQLAPHPATPPRAAEPMPPHERDALVREFVPLVKYHAGMLKLRLPPHIELDDLISSGIVGLLDALDRFDNSRGIKFKTYAEFRIRGAMLDYLREMDWFPRSVRQRATNLQNVYAQLEVLLGRPPEEDEVANHLKIPLEELQKELSLTTGLTIFSLDAPVDDEVDAGIQKAIAEAAMDENKEEEILRDLKEVLGKAIDLLPEKEKHLIALYYYEELTMKEIGSLLSLGEPRICQLHNQAVLRLRGKLRQQLLR